MRVQRPWELALLRIIVCILADSICQFSTQLALLQAIVGVPKGSVCQLGIIRVFEATSSQCFSISTQAQG